MHASSVDLSKTLFALGKTGTPAMPILVPTPNHSHVIDNSRVNAQPIWWEVRPVLVMDQTDWPAADGSSGITSASIMDDVEVAGRAIEVGSNFFLFFSSHMSSTSAHMHAPPSGSSTLPQRIGDTVLAVVQQDLQHGMDRASGARQLAMKK